ncbi:hypothetical protein [Paracholeplasma manati]|uniref:hypothetical protein n=1 Tax=Paracholeplasma manati TaxID=591373 RepID=UPI002407909C|nr:hypothetical protein [Paracholeplasma manati]
MIGCYDVDNLPINASHHMYRANTLTTLAQELKPGDTVAYLTSAANWDNTGTAGTNTHLRSFIFWNYYNSKGYLYPELTYSRNWYGNAWDPGAINFTNNTVTLRVPWSGPTIPAGTKVSNGSSGGTYKYLALNNTYIPITWTYYSGIMSGVDLSGTNANFKFPPGTAKAKVGWLMNYQGTGETAWFANLSFGIDYTIINRPVAGDWFGDKTPVIGTDGVMEIGKYIDFHNADTDTEDYLVRVSGVNNRTFEIYNPNGYVRIGPENTSFAHFQTDRPTFYFGKRIQVDGNLGLYQGGNPTTFMESSTGFIKELGQRVYSPNNKPSLSDLGALTDTDQKLLFGGSTQYIRLAYSGNTQAFIKHGADATEEELWHSGNFNPSDYMPKSGGTFTGTVAFTGLTSFDTLDINTMYVDTISSDGGSISFGGVDNINFGYIDLVGIRGLYSETDSFQLSDENIPTLRCGPTGAGTFEVYGNIWTDGDITSKSRKVITEGPTAAKTANYTFVLGDANGFIYSNSASALTFTIPLYSSVAYPTGTEIHIMRYGTGEISISPTSGVTLVSEGSKRRINAQYQAASLKKLDTNTWVLIGALKT